MKRSKKLKKFELIVDNDRNQQMVIIENIVEDPIEVQYQDESTTHNPQVLFDLLKMATQHVDFLGVKNFNFIIDLFLIDVVNKLKVDERKIYGVLQNLIKLLKHSKYLFIWNKRFQILTINSRTSFALDHVSPPSRYCCVTIIQNMVCSCLTNHVSRHCHLDHLMLATMVLKTRLRAKPNLPSILGFG